MTALPFSFKPDWSNPITERLSWLTTVMTSRSGAEQRYAVRITPRRQFDIPLLLTGQERTYFDTILARNGGGTWNVPIVHEEKSIGPISAGQTRIYLDPAYTEIGVGVKLLLRDDWYRSEVVTVTNVTDTYIDIEPTVLTYQAATITPTFEGVIAEAVSTARKTARIYQVTVRFTSIEAAVWPVNSRELPTLTTAVIDGKTFPILTQEPNAINDLDYSYERIWSVIDSDVAIPAYIDKAQRQFTSQKYEFFLVGRAERSNFRDMLYALRGRQQPIWVPTFNDDITYGAGHAVVYPNQLGLTGTITGREYFLEFRTDGTVASGLAVASTGGATAEEIDTPTVFRRSFVNLKRLDVDDIEIQHYGTLDGAATCSVIFRDAPDLRVPAIYTSPPLTDPVYHHGGPDGHDDVTPTNDVAADNPTLGDLIAEQTVT